MGNTLQNQNKTEKQQNMPFMLLGKVRDCKRFEN